jgi:hypothetical protein
VTSLRLAVLFGVTALFFVARSFYGMRIAAMQEAAEAEAAAE